MRDFTLGHLSDAVLVRDLKDLVARDREITAVMLAHLGEVDARRLYAPAGYSSMFAYCCGELHFSEDAAYKRIQAARAARRFPQLLTAIAEGRIHLTGAGLLAPHLTEDNVDEFISAANHRGKSDIEEWLAARSGSLGPARVPGSSIRPLPQLAPAQVEGQSAQIPLGGGAETSLSEGEEPRNDSELAPAQVDEASNSAISGPRFLVQFTIDQETHERLRHVQALLSHAVPVNDVSELFRRALDALAAEVEKKKLGSVPGSARASALESAPERNPNPPQPKRSTGRPLPRTRYISPRIRRAVWERDQAKCTFVSTAGHRCGERRFLEFDHVDPVARGGRATVDGLRLRCRAHNQLEADRIFGAGFMSEKREQARASRERLLDIVEGLRTLGCRGPEARRAAENALSLENTTLEGQMRAALAFVARRGRVSISEGRAST